MMRRYPTRDEIIQQQDDQNWTKEPTKEQPMSDTLQEGKDQKVWLECCQGYTHAPWCTAYEETVPCQRCEGIATTTVNTRHFGIEKLCEPCAVNVRRDGQEVSSHEPAARGGGDEWRVAQRYDGVVLIVRQESDNRETPLLTLGKSDDDYVMADKIVTEHNQHQSLMAEREVLREALRGVRLMLQTELKQYQSEPWAQRVNEAYEKDGPR